MLVRMKIVVVSMAMSETVLMAIAHRQGLQRRRRKGLGPSRQRHVEEEFHLLLLVLQKFRLADSLDLFPIGLAGSGNSEGRGEQGRMVGVLLMYR